MSVAVKASQLPTRIATGAFLLNAGLGKSSAKPDQAEHLHSMAKRAYPVLEQVSPETFTKALSMTEIALGAMLVTPIVPAWMAGAGLTAFAGGLLGLYWRTPEMHEEHSVRPTAEGIPLAKDVWMASIGVSLVVSSVSQVRLRGRGTRARKSRKH
jgi:hypothetical protein